MPIYEYLCDGCGEITSVFRAISKRDLRHRCVCGQATQRIISAPAVQVWNTDRAFPEVSEYGDGSMTFETKKHYESHLQEKGIAEVSTDAPIKRPHGNRVVGTWR